MADLTHVRQMWEQDAASRGLGIELVEVDVREGLGRARTRMTVRDTMVNGHQIAHGGYVFMLADSTFALACNATGAHTVAAGADITFVAAAHLGETLVAEAVERTTYGRNGITDVTVTRESNGELVAEFRGRSRQARPAKDSRPTPVEGA